MILMEHFQQLAESRRQWIQDVLIPWCAVATLRDLREAEHDWNNIAGRVDPKATLWSWAWGRFPDLVHGSLPGVNETIEVAVTLSSGETVIGYPENTLTVGGQLILLGRSESGEMKPLGPFSIDNVVAAVATDQSTIPKHVEFTRPPTVLPPNMDMNERL
jgi:hypothetical protein